MLHFKKHNTITLNKNKFFYWIWQETTHKRTRCKKEETPGLRPQNAQIFSHSSTSAGIGDFGLHCATNSLSVYRLAV